jgi:hypothetical protein
VGQGGQGGRLLFRAGGALAAAVGAVAALVGRRAYLSHASAASARTRILIFGAGNAACDVSETLRKNDPNFRQTLQINLGGGSGRFQRIDAVNLVSDGLLASAGIELTPNLGLSAGWVGKGINASLSYVPLREVPIYIALSGANLANNDGRGRAVALSLSWGGSFRTASFP